MRLYHGSNTGINSINLAMCRPYKDFGIGFYLTDIREQAERMAVRVAKIYGGSPVLNVFDIQDDFRELPGIKIKDFYGFIQANQMLDKLYKFARQYENMSPQEQIIYLAEAEKIFNAFDNVPDTLWEEEYDKYKEVLKKYKDIKMLRWASTSNKSES